MNKLYTLLIAILIISGFYSCKKDAKQPETAPTDYKALVTGKWTRTHTVDTSYYNGNMSASSGIAYSDYTYVFNSDGTGKMYQLNMLVFDLKYTVKKPNISINVTQAYNEDGSTSNIHIIPFSLNFIKLTDTEMVLHKDTTTIVDNGSTWRQISYDTYIKTP